MLCCECMCADNYALQLPLLHHYHPTVSLHARQLLSNTPLTATPDLALNTLSHFLDRFVYKNPKKPRTKGPSVMQPAASAADGTAVKMTKSEVTDEGGLVVNEETWWRRKVEDVPVDQVRGTNPVCCDCRLTLPSGSGLLPSVLHTKETTGRRKGSQGCQAERTRRGV